MKGAHLDSTGFSLKLPSLQTSACYTPATLDYTKNRISNGVESNI